MKGIEKLHEQLDLLAMLPSAERGSDSSGFVEPWNDWPHRHDRCMG